MPIAPAEKARAIARNLDLFQEYLDVIRDDPDREPPDPVSVFLPPTIRSDSRKT